jgi:hypothetical protein
MAKTKSLNDKIRKENRTQLINRKRFAQKIDSQDHVLIEANDVLSLLDRMVVQQEGMSQRDKLKEMRNLRFNLNE